MDIGTRLRELRQAKGFSQGVIEKRTGLFRCYISRVECGHTIPSLETQEKWAKALDLELYQLFFAGKREPEAPEVPEVASVGSEDRKLMGVLKEMPPKDRRLLLSLARKMVKQRKKRR
jgi:transcriptional regulator with XRE-family HTH domain